MTNREALQVLIRSRLNECEDSTMAYLGWNDVVVLIVGFLLLMTPAIVFYFLGV